MYLDNATNRLEENLFEGTLEEILPRAQKAGVHPTLLSRLLEQAVGPAPQA